MLDQLFLVHAGILGVISFAVLAVGNSLGVYWMRSKKLVKRQRQVHGYFATTAYVLATIHVGQGLSAYVQLQGEIVELALIIHWVHISLAIAFLAFFTKVLIDGYRGVMRCRRGHILLVLNAVLIVLGYVIRNITFGEIIYPFL